MRQLFNGSRRKKLVSTALIAVLAACFVVAGSSASVRADTSGTDYTINISECNPQDNAIRVDISQNGSYTLTGSNIVGDKRIDATFTVPSGKEVDIYLKGVDIYNGYYLSPGCSSSEAKPVFIINGTANIHVSSNSSITGLCEMFRVNGVLNFVNSEGEATLTVNRSIYGDFYGTYPMISGDDGKVHYKGARVTFVNKVNGGATDGDAVPCKGHTYIDCDVIPQTEGGPVIFDDVCLTAYQVPGMDSLKIKDSLKPHDIYNQNVTKRTITGLPEGGEVVQLVTLDGTYANNPIPATRRAVSNLCADSEGKLENVCLPDNVEIYISSGSTVSCYVSTYGSVKGTKPAYKVDFVDKENTSVAMGSYWVKEGDKVTLLEENGIYNYTYTDSLEGGNTVTAETTISADTTIYVTKTAKPKVTITVDGEEWHIDPGATLASAGLVGTYACKETKSIVDPGNTTVTDSITLMKVDLQTEVKDGETWFKIFSAEELDKFAKLVTEYGITDINGFLKNDINSYNGTMIGSYVLKGDNYRIDFDKSNFFRGSFDGNGRTVTLEYESNNTGILAGLFGSVSAGAEIKNVITEGSVNGSAQFTGALVASVICQNGDAVKIDNCINKAEVTTQKSESKYIGGLVGGKYVDYTSDPGNRVMELSITNCVNTGKVSGGAENSPSGIIGRCMDSSETTISGCINYRENLPITPGQPDNNMLKVYNSYSLYVDSAESNGSPLLRGTQVPKEAFKSGEVAYLLYSEGGRRWGQLLGTDDLPKVSNDENIDTVYRGYASCEATAPFYSNTEIAHTEQGHKAGTTYSYAGGKISAGCIYCQGDVSAEITLPKEYLGEQTGAKVKYNSQWTALNCPEITFRYAAKKDGEYSSVLPKEEGQWYVRAYVCGQNIDIDGTYTIKKKPTTPVDPNGGSGTSGGNSGTTGGSGESGATRNPADTGNKDNKTGKDSEEVKNTAVENKVEKLSELYGEDVQLVGTTSTVDEAVKASKKDGVFVTSTGEVAASTFVEGKNGKTYFTDDEGKPVTNSIVTDGKNSYFCGKSGAVICNKPVTLTDGKRMLTSENGAIITKNNAKVNVNGKSFLTVKGGILASSEIVTTKNGKLYYANKNGVVVVNKTVEVDGVQYKAGKNGVLKIVK